MPASYPTYASKISEAAGQALASLPAESQVAWIHVQNDLTRDPVGNPRSRPMSISGAVFLYSQSDPPLEITYEVDSDAGTIYFMHFTAPLLQQRKKTICVVCSKLDVAILEEATKWLGHLEETGLAELWDVHKVPNGADLGQSVEEALDSARMVLLLVTQELLKPGGVHHDSLAVDALVASTRDHEIQWIATGQSLYKTTGLKGVTPLNDKDRPLLGIKRMADRDEVWVNIYEQIEQIVTHW